MTTSLRALRALYSLAGLLALAACDESSATPDASAADAGADAGPSTRGAVVGTITYAGEASGRLTVGVWPSTPPAGPPIEFFAVDDPTFPVEYSLEGLAAGTYYLGVVLDLGANNPTIPGEEDPRLFPTDGIVVEGGDTHERDVDLVDP